MPFNAVIEEVLVKPGAEVNVGSPLVRYRLQDEAERVLQREVTMECRQWKSEIPDTWAWAKDLQQQPRNATRQGALSGRGSVPARRLPDWKKMLRVIKIA